jgi:hypothetical protein
MMKRLKNASHYDLCDKIVFWRQGVRKFGVRWVLCGDSQHAQWQQHHATPTTKSKLIVSSLWFYRYHHSYHSRLGENRNEVEMNLRRLRPRFLLLACFGFTARTCDGFAIQNANPRSIHSVTSTADTRRGSSAALHASSTAGSQVGDSHLFPSATTKSFHPVKSATTKVRINKLASCSWSIIVSCRTTPF